MMSYDKLDLMPCLAIPSQSILCHHSPDFQGLALEDEGNISLATVSLHTEPAPAALRGIAQAHKV